MKKKIYQTREFSIFLRYLSIFALILIIQSYFFLDTLMKVFAYISYYFVSLFVTASLINWEIHIEPNTIFLIVEECIAPAAYMLIGIIFLTLPIAWRTIVKSIVYAFLAFTIFNILRIFILMWIHLRYGVETFDKYHLLFYDFLSGIGVGLIIIYFLYKYNIKKVYPIYSDVKYLISVIVKNKKK